MNHKKGQSLKRWFLLGGGDGNLEMKHTKSMTSSSLNVLCISTNREQNQKIRSSNRPFNTLSSNFFRK